MQVFAEKSYQIVHSGPKMAEGLDFEIINTQEFLALSEKNLTILQKEHPTLYFYENKKTYSIFDFEPLDRDDSGFRITLDEKRDLLVLQLIAEHFKDQLVKASWEEIRSFLEKNKSVFNLNSTIERNEGLRLDREKKDKA
jgi:spore coat polysaccharide biosynthesis protein SpsF (cytidylyltransferase family)